MENPVKWPSYGFSRNKMIIPRPKYSSGELIVTTKCLLNGAWYTGGNGDSLVDHYSYTAEWWLPHRTYHQHRMV